MRMLLPKKPLRELDLSPFVMAEPLEPARAEALEAEQHASTHDLGARQEVLSSTLEEIARLADHLKRLEPMVGELRAPLASEMAAHKREHSELITVRAVLEQTSERLTDVQERERMLLGNLAVVETQLENAQAAHHAKDVLLEDTTLQIDRLCNALQEAEAKAVNTSEALRDSNLRLAELQEDASVLRRQAQEDDEGRREVDMLLAKANQNMLLLEEETANLRRRSAQSTNDAARFARGEQEALAQLQQERNRIAPMQAQMESAQAEVLALTRAMAEQSDAACAGIAELHTRLETAVVRGNRLEALNADLSRKLSDAGTQQRTAGRRANEGLVAVERATERVKVLEEEVAQHRAANAAVERARLVALERADQLGKLLQTHEVAMRRGEERVRELQTKLDGLIADTELTRRAADQRLSDATVEIERLRAETAITESALKAARSERARVHFAALNGGGLEQDHAPPLRGTMS